MSPLEKKEERISSGTMDGPVGRRAKPHDFPSFSKIFLIGLLLNQTPLLYPLPAFPQGSVKPCWRCSCTPKSGESLGEGEREGGGKSGKTALTPSGLYSKEVQAEREPTREYSEVKSVTQHDYQKELVQAGPPAPTKVRTHPTPHAQLGSGRRWESSRPRG